MDQDENIDVDLKKTSRCCRPLLVLMNFAGINIRFDDQSRSRVFLWLWRVCLILISTYVFSIQIFTSFNGISIRNFWLLCYSDYFVVYTFIYIFSFRCRSIVQFTKTVLQMAAAGQPQDQVYTQIKRKAWFLSIMAIVLEINTPILLFTYVKTLSTCEQCFSYQYFGLMSSAATRQLIVAVSEMIYFTMCLAIELYGIFVVFLVYILGLAYGHLNESFVRMKRVYVKDLTRYQQQHEVINLLTNEFNDLFSPAILVLIISKMGLIIGTTGYIKAQQSAIQSWSADAYTISNSLMPGIRAVFLIAMLLAATHSVHHNSEEIFRRLLLKCQEHPEIYEDSLKELMKGVSQTMLFSAQWFVSPVTINASGWFKIDKGLIGVILSVTGTYWALISDVQNDGCEQYMFNSVVLNKTF